MKILFVVLMQVTGLFYAGILSGKDNPATVYKKNCMVCHGADGEASMPGIRDLSDIADLKEARYKKLLARVKMGVRASGSNVEMPPKGGNPALTDVQLLGVLKYMNRLALEK